MPRFVFKMGGGAAVVREETIQNDPFWPCLESGQPNLGAVADRSLQAAFVKLLSLNLMSAKPHGGAVSEGAHAFWGSCLHVSNELPCK